MFFWLQTLPLPHHVLSDFSCQRGISHLSSGLVHKTSEDSGSKLKFFGQFSRFFPHVAKFFLKPDNVPSELEQPINFFFFFRVFLYYLFQLVFHPFPIQLLQFFANFFQFPL